MRLRSWPGVVGLSLLGVGAGLAVRSFLPQRMAIDVEVERQGKLLERSAFPEIEVSFLRCGSVTVPECIAVRGALTLAPRVIAHSAVLIRHPQGTFLYDSGLCADIQLFLADQSLYFRKTLANFILEQPIGSQLQRLGVQPGELDFVLLSHLHWDHVSGIPDLPDVPLRIHRLEYVAGEQSLLKQHKGLVRRLMGNNQLELFDCTGGDYEGFQESHDLFGDGSIVLVPLAGHTPGQVGMFINRANGQRLLLVGDAAWVAENYLRPATMHPFIWSRVTSEDARARQTLVRLHHFARQYPEVPLIAMHDARLQEAFMLAEQAHILQMK